MDSSVQCVIYIHKFSKFGPFLDGEHRISTKVHRCMNIILALNARSGVYSLPDVIGCLCDSGLCTIIYLWRVVKKDLGKSI